MNLKDLPITNHELILRLRDPGDHEAWRDFVQLYEPMIRRVAAKLGMKPESAADASQEVLLQLSQVVNQWKPQMRVGSFRGWLNVVARNSMIRMLQKRDLGILGSGRTDVHQLLAELPNRDSQESKFYDVEFRKLVFAQVVRDVQADFRERTWRAFWMSSIDEVPVAEVAEQLAISVGAVYIARSRVMKRIKTEVKKLVDDQWESFSGTQLETMEHPKPKP